MASDFPIPPKFSNATIQAKTSAGESLGRQIGRWPLGRKLMAVYGVAFAFTICGGTLGFAISQQNEQKALAAQVEAIEDVEQISRVKSSLTEVLLHQQPLVNLLEASGGEVSPELRIKLAHFIEEMAVFKDQWQVLTMSDEFEVAGEAGIDADVTEAEADLAAAISQDYDAAVMDYLSQMDRLVAQINPASIQAEQLPLIRSTMTALNQSTFVTGLSELLKDIDALSEASKEERAEAAALLEGAALQQVRITVGSLLLAGMIGLMLVQILSRLLLRPLKEMTHLTQQSIQTADFGLQVPVANQDEVGVLAETFNAYSDMVSQLLVEFQLTNQELQQTLDELHTTQVQMVQQEKMSSLGQLVAGVAHEINNPVGFIHGNLSHIQGYAEDLLKLVALYQTHYPKPVAEIDAETRVMDLQFIQSDFPKALSSMKLGTQRIRDIVQSLRNFSRTNEFEIGPIDIHEGLDNTLMILNHRLKATPDHPEIEVIKDYGDLPPIQCFAGLLNQVFMNILVNAVDALEEDLKTKVDPDKHPGKITLRTALLDRGLDEPWVEIAIANNGPPIPPEVKNRLFDPFFTTKPVGKGTGIGLSISYQIVTDKHGGKLDCFSAPGQGTEFVLQLPVHPPSDEADTPDTSPQSQSGTLALSK